ncbi:MAG: hypothetical protein KGV46_02615 [Pasteurella sp.]|nr:hypothetical protein [Pasteurella sp.]
MIIRINGGSSGICAYLSDGMKSGREYSRDELDERVVLSGDLEQLDSTLALFDKNSEHEKYLHITLSFKEKEISQGVLKSIDTDFQKFLFTACRSDEFYYYSEAHLPKIQSLPDKEGKEYERFPHIHVVIPEFNQITGKREEFLGRRENILHFFNAFQETVNYKYNLESPKDNFREISGGREEILNRHKLTAEMTRKEVKEQISQIVKENKNIHSVDDLAAILSGFGKATVRDSRKFGQPYINLAFADGRKAINLKDPIFLNDYLSTRNPMLIGKQEQEERDKLLEKWEQQAQKIRFIDRESPKNRQAYKAMSEIQQRHYLRKAMSKHLDKLESISPIEPHISRKQIPPHTQHFEQANNIEDIRHLDDIPHIDDLPHIDQINHFEEEKYEQEHTNQLSENQQGNSRHDMSRLRVRRSNGGSGTKKHLSEQDILPPASRHNLERDEKVELTDVYSLRAKGNISREQQYGRIATVVANSKSEWTDKINSIDMRFLLNHLSYRYGIDADNIQIVRSKKGYERIKIDKRQYSASDFMAKHLHLSWNEIREHIDSVLEKQAKELHRATPITSNLMWNRFQRYEEKLEGLSHINTNFRTKRTDILSRTLFVENPAQTKAQNFARRQLLRQQRKAEIQEALDKLYNDRRYYLQPPNNRYLEWLHTTAVEGDKSALEELNRVYPTHEKDYSLTFLNKSNDRFKKSAFSPFELGFKVHINKRGQVEYRNDDNKAVIIDTRTSIRVKSRDAETIAKALLLAQQRFGVDGFEITNATEKDRQAIQQAVNETQTTVTLKSSKATSSIERI